MSTGFIYFKLALLFASSSCQLSIQDFMVRHGIQHFRRVTTSDLRVVNWDLNLLQIKWKIGQNSKMKNLAFNVTLFGEPMNEFLVTTEPNITWRGQVCLKKTATVTPIITGSQKIVGKSLTIDLREVFYGDELNVRGAAVDYFSNYPEIVWQKSRSICVDSYDVSYAGKNYSISQGQSVLNTRMTHKVNEKTSDVGVIVITPLHKGIAIDPSATKSINVSALVNLCQGQRPGVIKDLTWKTLRQFIPGTLFIEWEICHYNTSLPLVNETNYDITTKPENYQNVYIRERSKDSSFETVVLNVGDVCRINNVTIHAVRNKTIIDTKVLHLSSWLYDDERVYGLRLTRNTMLMKTLRWKPVTRRHYFNCTETYEVKFYARFTGFNYVTTDTYFTFTVHIPSLQSATVQLIRNGFPLGTPTKIDIPLPSNSDVDVLRVTLVRRDLIGFEWPEYEDHVIAIGSWSKDHDSPVEYSVRLIKTNETLQFITADLDFEWEGDPCLLREVTVHPIKNDRPVGEMHRLNLTNYFYEDIRELRLLSQGQSKTTLLKVPMSEFAGRHCVTGYIIRAEPGGHVKEGFAQEKDIVEKVNMSPCEIKMASIQPLRKNEPVGWQSFYNLTRSGGGTMPKLNVSAMQYGLKLFVSWYPKYDNYTMCPQDVKVKINVSSDCDSHVKEVIGAEVDQVFDEIAGDSDNSDVVHFDKLVPCRPYTMVVTTSDGVVHFNETRTLLPKNNDSKLELKSKKADSASVLLELGWEAGEERGDCVPKLYVQCYPSLPNNNFSLVTNEPGSGFLKLYGLPSGEFFSCVISDDAEMGNNEMRLFIPFSFKTDDEGVEAPKNNVEEMVESLFDVRSIIEFSAIDNYSTEAGVLVQLGNDLANVIGQKAEDEAQELVPNTTSSDQLMAESTSNYIQNTGAH